MKRTKLSDLVGKYAKIVKYEPFVDRSSPFVPFTAGKSKIYEILAYKDGMRGKYYLFRENRAGLGNYAVYEDEIEFEMVEIEENAVS